MDIELFKVAMQGDEKELKRIIERKPRLLEGKAARQNTVLHIASRLGHIRFIEALSMQFPLLLVAQNCKGDTALHIAARAELPDVVSNLIECAKRGHLKEDMLMKVNKEENTALHEAARNRHARVVHLLLNEQPELVYKINKDEASPLYMAAEGGCLNNVKYILEVVKKLADEATRQAACRGPENRTPLHVAVMPRRLDIARKLIKERKGFAGKKDAHGNYPLHYASACGNSKMVEIILDYDTSVAHLTNDEGQFPIHVAAGKGHIDVIKEIQRVCPDSCEAIDNRGWNALHFAVESRKVEVVKHILNSNEFGELINEPNDEGNTPLHLTFTKYNYQVFELLVRDKRIDVNVMNREGKTALDIAESDGELLTWKFRKFQICNALQRVGGKRGLYSIDNADKERQYDSYKNMANILLVVAGLIITVSFTALFTIPGGFNSDGPNKGKATLSRKPLLWAFVITDGISLFSALYIAFLLFLTAAGDPGLMVGAIGRSLKVIVMSLGSLTLTFVFGLWLVLSKVVAITFLIIFSVGFSGASLVWFGPAPLGPSLFPSPFQT